MDVSEAHNSSSQAPFISGSWIIDATAQNGSKDGNTAYHQHSGAVAQRALFGLNKRRTGSRKISARDARTPSRLSRVSVADEDDN